MRQRSSAELASISQDLQVSLSQSKHQRTSLRNQGSPLIQLLHHAPQLLRACKAAGVFKQLRSVCQDTNQLATAHITHLTIDLEQPATLPRLLRVLHLAKVCRLQCLHLVIHLKRHGGFLTLPLFGLHALLRG